MCQSHTGRLTGLWFLPKPAFGLNTNDDDTDKYIVVNLLSRAKVESGKCGLVEVVTVILGVSRAIWIKKSIVLSSLFVKSHKLWDNDLFMPCTYRVTQCLLCNDKIFPMICWWFFLQIIKKISIKFCTRFFTKKYCLLRVMRCPATVLTSAGLSALFSALQCCAITNHNRLEEHKVFAIWSYSVEAARNEVWCWNAVLSYEI